MTWTDRTGLSSKQLTGIIISLITLIGVLALSYARANLINIVSPGSITTNTTHTSSLYINGEKYYNESEASYMVWVSQHGIIPKFIGSTYYAKNEYTGVVTSNINATTLIQACIDNTSTNLGGVVLLKTGSYYIQNLDVKAGVGLEGEVELYTPGNVHGTNLYPAAGQKGIICEDFSSIMNLRIDGNDASGIGLYIYHHGAIQVRNVGIVKTQGTYGAYIWTWDAYFDNLQVEYCKNTDGILLNGGTNVVLFHCTSWGNDYSQWDLTGSARNTRLLECRAGRFSTNGGRNGIIFNTAYGFVVDGAEIYNNTRNGILIYGSSKNTVTNCQIKDNSQAGDGVYDGIQIGDNGGGNHSTDNIITQNTIISDTGVRHDYSIRELDANQNYNIIKNNVMIGAKIGNGLIGGANSMWNSNVGFVTENHGTATFTIGHSTLAITHNLAIIPIAGQIQITPTTGLGNCTSYAITAYTSSTFTITLYDSTGTAKGSSIAVGFAWIKP